MIEMKRQMNPLQVQPMVTTKPIVLRLPSLLYMPQSVLKLSLITCRVRSIIIKIVAKTIIQKGPYCQEALRRLWHEPRTYCAMLVSKARLMPQVMVCAKLRASGVLKFAKLENNPARSRGQHQLPTRAGIEHRRVAKATRADRRSSAVTAAAGA